MIIYGDILFAENLIIGGVLLYITGEIFGAGFTKARDKLRFAAGSIMCGFFSLAVFLSAKAPIVILLELGFAFLVCLVVFGKVMLWRRAFTFVLVTYFMGGMSMALLLVTGNRALGTAAGIYTGDMKAGLLALFVGLCVFTSKQVIKAVSKRKFHQEHFFYVKVSAGDFSGEIRAFLDTGNQLREPLSGKPAAVAGERLWQTMVDGGAMAAERVCVVPYESIGGKGLMEAVRTEYIEIKGRRIRGCVIARGDGKFDLESEGIEGCQLLLSKYMTDSRI